MMAQLRRMPTRRIGAWWGPSLILIGLTLVSLSLSTVWALGVVGLLSTAGGLGIVAAAVGRRHANPVPPG